jgi:hypothetical protein
MSLATLGRTPSNADDAAITVNAATNALRTTEPC